MNRDWQQDLELAHKARYGYKLNQLNPVLDALFYWLQQYAAEKERTDSAEAMLSNQAAEMLRRAEIINKLHQEIAELKARGRSESICHLTRREV